ncbi:MAG: hypothetical protein FJY75_07235 [Candidatus Eisenbacteria bacterium]|uniref:FlgD/Vpr Ig-like domain-containing protein n=1 Tax=Eiseniibacteriota bacterium TaxID=2212470 RepID=A0A937X8R8_UNCEI|nr:hypothetical protein [Candidatus Eisenbacteria bacterium]
MRVSPTARSCRPLTSRARSGLAAARAALRPMALALALAPVLAASASADPPRGGEVLLLDRQNLGIGGRPLVMGVDPATYEIRNLTRASQFNAPRAVCWGRGKRLFVGDGPRFWSVDAYQDPTAPAVEVKHPWLSYLVDMAPDGDGGLYLVDQFADPLAEGYQGALFHYDPDGEAFSLVVSDARFVSPLRMVREAAGTILVLDPRGRMRWSAPANGAIYRVDPRTHAMESLLSLHLFTAPSSIALQDPSTLLLADADLSHPDYPPRRGGIVRIALADMSILDTLVAPELVQPTDLVRLPGSEILVLDEQANPGGYSGARGALFRFDLSSGELVGAVISSTFRTLTSIELYDGPDLDASSLELTDANGGSLRPGDRLRFDATLRAGGPTAPGPLDLTIDLGPLDCLLGTAAYERGSVAYDPSARLFRWSATLGLGEEVALSVDLRVPGEATDGTEYEIPVRLSGGLVDRTQLFSRSVSGALVPGLTVYVDGALSRPPAPRLFTLAADGRTPVEFAYEAPGTAPRPVDVAFAPDGTLYVLDTGAAGTATILAVDPVTRATRVVHQGAPLTIYTRALVVGHDGALRVVDPKAVAAIPGVVYRIDPFGGGVEVFYTAADADSFPNPVDICLDGNGRYLVVETDFLAGAYRSGGLFELNEAGNRIAIHTVPGQLIDPYTALVDEDRSIYLIDRADGSPGGPRFFWVRRPEGQGPVFVRLVGVPGLDLLKKPTGIVATAPDRFMICDREANASMGRGGLIRFDRSAPGAGSFVAQSLHADLREPTRADCYRPPRLVCSGLEMLDTNGGDLRPGDLVRVRAQLDNRTPTPGLAAGATVRYASILAPEYFSATRGSVHANPSFATVEWAGDLRYLDPQTIEIGFRVSPLAAHGARAEVEVTLLGGEAAAPATGSLMVVGPLTGDEFLVLDPRAALFNPLHKGTILAGDLAAGTMVPFRSQTAFVRPADILATAPNRILVLDRDADPRGLGGDTGALLELNADNNTVRTFAAGARMVDPVRLVPDPSGGWYILDRAAQPCPGEGRGAILRVGAAGGEPSLVACSELFRDPADLAVDDGGLLWIADRAANPQGLPMENTGAIFAVDPVTGAVVGTYAAEQFVDPAALLWVPGRGLVLTDPGYYSGGLTGIRRLNTATGALTDLVFSPYLGTPTRMLDLGDGRILLADSTAYPPGSAQRGAVFAVDLERGELGAFVQSEAAYRFEALASVPRPEVRFVRWQPVAEPARLHRASGEQVRCELVLDNPSPFQQSRVEIEVTGSATLEFVTGSGSASRGLLLVDGEGLRWTGSLGPADSVRIEYDALVTLLPGLPVWADQFASASGTFGTAAGDTLTFYISNAAANGELVLSDAWADARPGVSGGIFRAELHTHRVAPVLASPLLRAPIAVAFVPGSAAELLIADAQARPSGAGTGTLFRGSTRTGEVVTLFRHPSMRFPNAVAAADSFTAYLLDADADPFGLRPGGEGPGALYRIDLRTGEGAPFASDQRFWNPRDLALDQATGALYIIDSGNGTPSYPGGVFAVDPLTGAVTVVASGGQLASPRCATVGPDGTLYVMDSQGALGGTIYTIAPGSSAPAFFSQCSKTRNPFRMVLDAGERVLCVDAEANPLALPAPTGSVLRFLRGGSTCWVYASGAPFERPCGVAARFDGTPAVALALAALDSPGGVELRWDVPAALRGAGFFVYRRSPEVPGSEFEILNAQRPLTGSGEVAYLDASARAGELYEYLVSAFLPDGSRHDSAPVRIKAAGRAARFFLARPSPNPCPWGPSGGRITLSFGLPEPGDRVRLDLYDVSGRRAAKILDGLRPPGPQSIEWDGRDERGRLLESGFYMLRMEVGERTALRRLVLLR